MRMKLGSVKGQKFKIWCKKLHKKKKKIIEIKKEITQLESNLEVARKEEGASKKRNRKWKK